MRGIRCQLSAISLLLVEKSIRVTTVISMIALLGGVAYRELRFGAWDPQAYTDLKAAVRHARGD